MQKKYLYVSSVLCGTHKRFNMHASLLWFFHVVLDRFIRQTVPAPTRPKFFKYRHTPSKHALCPKLAVQHSFRVSRFTRCFSNTEIRDNPCNVTERSVIELIKYLDWRRRSCDGDLSLGIRRSLVSGAKLRTGYVYRTASRTERRGLIELCKFVTYRASFRGL